ncbi:hypothetical protein FN846DRAFT_1025726 [Sphaerosporella brunnea]|uniref:Uncharacterized protein n=1 Tax=Sphaerosporella brunnea TaxID=1250544 RepID=A0A5J5EEM1_9PEZI|nr:hypothetical protein FN846DRAFT_1025726 [Sphaerosporella brunnea]
MCNSQSKQIPGPQPQKQVTSSATTRTNETHGRNRKIGTLKCNSKDKEIRQSKPHNRYPQTQSQKQTHRATRTTVTLPPPPCHPQPWLALEPAHKTPRFMGSAAVVRRILSSNWKVCTPTMPVHFGTHEVGPGWSVSITRANLRSGSLGWQTVLTESGFLVESTFTGSTRTSSSSSMGTLSSSGSIGGASSISSSSSSIPPLALAIRRTENSSSSSPTPHILQPSKFPLRSDAFFCRRVANPPPPSNPAPLLSSPPSDAMFSSLCPSTVLKPLPPGDIENFSAPPYDISFSSLCPSTFLKPLPLTESLKDFSPPNSTPVLSPCESPRRTLSYRIISNLSSTGRRGGVEVKSAQKGCDWMSQSQFAVPLLRPVLLKLEVIRENHLHLSFEVPIAQTQRAVIVQALIDLVGKSRVIYSEAQPQAFFPAPRALVHLFSREQEALLRQKLPTPIRKALECSPVDASAPVRNLAVANRKRAYVQYEKVDANSKELTRDQKAAISKGNATVHHGGFLADCSIMESDKSLLSPEVFEKLYGVEFGTAALSLNRNDHLIRLLNARATINLNENWGDEFNAIFEEVFDWLRAASKEELDCFQPSGESTVENKFDTLIGCQDVGVAGRGAQGG